MGYITIIICSNSLRDGRERYIYIQMGVFLDRFKIRPVSLCIGWKMRLRRKDPSTFDLNLHINFELVVSSLSSFFNMCSR